MDNNTIRTHIDDIYELIPDKSALFKEVTETVEEYLARGGTITYVPRGAMTQREGISNKLTKEELFAKKEAMRKTMRRNPIPPYIRTDFDQTG